MKKTNELSTKESIKQHSEVGFLAVLLIIIILSFMIFYFVVPQLANIVKNSSVDASGGIFTNGQQ